MCILQLSLIIILTKILVFIYLEVATGRYCTKFGLFTDGRMGEGSRGGKRLVLPKISHTYPTMMKFGTVLPYLKKIRKI